MPNYCVYLSSVDENEGKKKNKTKPDGNLEGMASRDQLSALTCAPLPPSTQPDPTERYGYRYLALILNSRLIHQICVLTSSTAAAVAAFPVRSLSKQAGFDSKLGHLTRIQTCVASRRHLRFPSPHPHLTPPPCTHTAQPVCNICTRAHASGPCVHIFLFTEADCLLSRLTVSLFWGVCRLLFVFFPNGRE